MECPEARVKTQQEILLQSPELVNASALFKLGCQTPTKCASALSGHVLRPPPPPTTTPHVICTMVKMLLLTDVDCPVNSQPTLKRLKLRVAQWSLNDSQ